jgi:splicing factor 3A subunit 3
VVQEVLSDFDKEWNETGGLAGWERKYAEKVTNDGIDLSTYGTPDDLLANVSADAIKAELDRLGLKCGGAPLERAKRLFLTKDTPPDQLPAKLFAKGMKPDAESATNNTIVITGGGDRRVDLARLETTIAALLDQIRPTLDATIRRAERRQTQTPKERESELEEDLHGSNSADAKLKSDEDEDSGDEAPIYNPKGVPLGWDGKPIPYWLFKLHGLNHFYQCEICGNERYRGRRNFEKHFAEAKHGYGMKCLGIPNTMHFHGVTTIEDAQQLWSKLQGNLEEDQFDGTKQEEYEDSHGNVLTRSTYEDLARQGLL